MNETGLRFYCAACLKDGGRLYAQGPDGLLAHYFKVHYPILLQYQRLIPMCGAVVREREPRQREEIGYGER